MNKHASMNRIFRLVWNDSLNAYVPAAETARGRGKSSKRKLIAAALSLSAGIAQAGPASSTGPTAPTALTGPAAPTGGQVTSGSGSITQSGSTMTIHQASQNLALNWQSFNIAPQETVDFVQPNATAIAVNRILGTNGSVILGHLDANGQVYLINPNGVIFGKGAEVNVGGLVASTLNLADGTPGDGSKTFSGAGSGSIVNDGTINAASGGSIALLGNHVTNNGVISAQLGTVALGAGSAATLTFSGTHLVSMQIDQGVLNRVAANGGLVRADGAQVSVASNGGLIRADGGQVLMTAGAQKALLASVVNNTGIIEARTLENHEGTITLLGGMSAGTVNVAGTLDASAPDGGHGGAIETSAARVEIADSAKVSSAAARGLNGTWLIDPTDFSISAGTTSQSASGIGATTLQTELAGGNVSIATSAAGTQNGDINVNAPVSWSSNKLALTAAGDINVNAVMTASGSASLDLAPASNNVNMGFNPDGSFAGQVNFSGSGTLRMNVGGALQVFTVIDSLGVATDATGGAHTLQGMAASGNLAANFALGGNIDASATSGWNACTTCNNGGAGFYGFTPIGGGVTPFTGNIDGLGHTITNLKISRPTADNVGLVGSLGVNGNTAPVPTVRNVALVGGSVTGNYVVGGLVGVNYGLVSNSSFDAGTVAVLDGNGGGLVGSNYGTISNSHASGTLTFPPSNFGSGNLGGLTGANYGTVTRSYAAVTMDVGNTDDADLGGLIGYSTGAVSHSYATGNVTAGYEIGIAGTASHDVGGLVGKSNNGAISDSYATGTVTILGTPDNVGFRVGGLVGDMYSGSITRSYATGGIVSGANYVGGLVGFTSYGSSVSLSHATGSVTGNNYVGGLAGYTHSALNSTYATGNVTATGRSVGGLVGENAAEGTILDSYATGAVSGGNYAGGLAGENGSSTEISNSYATGSVSGGHYTGGLLGINYGEVSDTYATHGSVTGTAQVGGLVGANWRSGSVTDSYAAGVVTGANFVGALLGYDLGTATHNFYDSDTNPRLTGIGDDGANLPDVAGVVGGLNGAQMQSQANFTSATSVNGNVDPAWDFANVWVMYEGHTAPLLRVFMTPLTVGGGVASKTYDKVPYAGSLDDLAYSIAPPDFAHLLGTVSVAGNAAGVVHVGTYTFMPGGLYSDQQGYIISYTSSSLTIKPAPLTVTGTVATKVYDGTTAAILTDGLLSGLMAGDNVTLTQTGTYATPHAGRNIAVAVTDSIAGSNLGDYSFTPLTGLTGTITPATLTVSGTSVGAKVYDGTTVAALIGGSLVGVVGGDTVTLTQGGSFAYKHVGTGIAVTAGDSLGGSSAGDYILIDPTGLAGNITPATLTVSGTTVGSKLYDGTNAAHLMGGSLVGVISGDTVTLDQSGLFASTNPGTGIAVAATDSLGGASADDYRLVEPTGLLGTILPASPGGGSEGSGGSSDSGGSALALNARTQIVENFIYPQLGANPQVINASPTIVALAASADDASAQASAGVNGMQQAIVVNVSMKIGANGTLKIENGGLRLPSYLVVGNE